MNVNGRNWVISGGQAVRGDHISAEPVVIVDGCFVDAAPVDARAFDADGLTLAPGVIDVHGDGFERNLSPRPNVHFDLDTAILETDRQLISNGITTAYLALTVSWEPGLRSLEMGRKVVAALQRLRPNLSCDIRLQLRWEIFALEAADQIAEWLTLDPTPTLAFNDHFVGMRDGKRMVHKLGQYASRAGLSEDEYKALMDEVASREGEVPIAVARLAAAAQKLGVICFAHDEETVAARRENRSMGITVSEFPLAEETARDAVNAGEHTILGAPNVMRGGSHVGAMDAGPAVKAGLCTVLASDYYFPAPLSAVLKLSEGVDDLPRFWPVVAGNAAAACGLNDRGTISAGRRADLVAFRNTAAGPVVEAVFCGGTPSFIRDAARVL